MPTEWQVFPRSARPHPTAYSVVEVLDGIYDKIDSTTHSKLESNDVLRVISADLEAAGYDVERSKAKADKISVPVLFGRNGRVEKSFDADAFHEGEGVVLEVEAGRAVDNNQYLKDLFQACVMQDAKHLVICVRKVYGKKQQRDFEAVVAAIDTLYTSNRLRLPLQTVMIVGY